MTHRERVLAAIEHRVPDRVPVDAICIETVSEIAEYLHLPPEAVPDRLGLDGRIIAAPYTGELPRSPEGTPLTEWGAPNTGDYGTAFRCPLAGARSIADIERFAWPDPAAYDYLAAAAAARNLGREYAVRGPYWRPLFCQVCNLFGMEEAMVRMVSDEAVFEAALVQVFERTAVYCERLLDACGDAMPIFCLGDDVATQRGLMVRPEHWRRWLKPLYARLFGLGKGRGRKVWFHSCGDITAVLPDLIDIGMDVWETVQLHALPLSAAQLKRTYGRHLTFFGGVNTQRLPWSTPAAVREETRRCLEALAEGGGYICGPEHHI
jgi:uroporphyrinogen decarboxylase